MVRFLQRNPSSAVQAAGSEAGPESSNSTFTDGSAMELGIKQRGLTKTDSAHSIGFYGQVRRIESSHSGRNLQRVVIEDEQGSHSEDTSHLMSWQTTGMVMIGDVVGMGILTMGIAMAQLGWALGLFFVFTMCPVNVYMGILLSEGRTLIPAAYSYKDLATFTLGRKWFTTLVQITFYSYIFLALGGYILAVGEGIMMVFYEVALCQPIWGLIGILALLLPCQMQTFNEATWLVWANFASILVAVLMSLVYMLVAMKSPAKTYAVAEDLDWVDFFNGVSKITFSYLGCYIYLEIMSEMKKPSEFPKSFIIAAPFQLTMYAMVGIISYLYDGAAAVHVEMIVWEIPIDRAGTIFRVTSIFLLVHLIVAYLIKSTILTRALIMAWAPPHILKEGGTKARLLWLAVSSGIMVVAYLISSAIPIFSKITSIMGALNAPLLGFIFPIVFCLGVRHNCDIRTSKVEYLVMAVIVVFAVVLLFAGTTANILSLVQHLEKIDRRPFECQWMSFEEMQRSMVNRSGVEYA